MADEPRAHGPTFGSRAVLASCWSTAALAGTPADRLIRHGPPQKSPAPPSPYLAAAGKMLRPLSAELRGSIRAVEPSDRSARLVALSFDLCEGPKETTGYDAAIVNYLRAQGVKATFFAGGKWMASHPDKAKQLMADPLFEVGNHSWTHRNLHLAREPEGRDQILWPQAEYLKLRDELAHSPCAARAGTDAVARIPRVPRLFRFPYGVCSGQSLQDAADAGLAAIQWSIVTGDPAPHQTPRAIADTILRGMKAQRGAIVVAHANGRGWRTAEALPLFVPEVMRRGYRFVTVSELLASGRPVAADQCYEVRPGDNGRYDVLARKGAAR